MSIWWWPFSFFSAVWNWPVAKLWFHVEYLGRTWRIGIDKNQPNLSAHSLFATFHERVGISQSCAEVSPYVKAEWLSGSTWCMLVTDADLKDMIKWASLERLEVINIRLTKGDSVPESRGGLTMDWTESLRRHHMVAMRLLNGSQNRKIVQFQRFRSAYLRRKRP